MPEPRPRPFGPINVGKKGLVTLPQALREDLGIDGGERLTFYLWPGEKRALIVVGTDPTDEGYPALPV